MLGMNSNGVGIYGVGKYIPQKVITNKMIEKWTGLSTQTITEKVGIEKRHVAEDHETASGMSAIAARKAIKMACIDASEIDLIISSTFTSDYIYPAMSCKVQDLIGAKNAGAFDIKANCTGFQVALTIASDRIRLDHKLKYILVIATTLQSRYIDWTDPHSTIYFGDGSGAAVIGRAPSGYGILSSEIYTNSRAYEALRMRGGGSSFPMREDNVNKRLQYCELDGLEAGKQVLQYQPEIIQRSLSKVEKELDDVDFFLLHQANHHLIKFLMQKLDQPIEKTLIKVKNTGNTADASLAIILNDAVHSKLIKRDNIIVISGAGAGFTFGSSVIRWY